jgi:hypothetical protein
MTGALIASYALSTAGVGLLAWTGWLLAARRVDETVANPLLIKLAKEDNLDRVRTLCSAAPGSYLDAVGGACRAISSEAGARAAFDTTAAEFVQQWRKTVERGWFGALLVAGGCVLALADGALPTGLAIVGGLGALGVALVFALRNAASRAIAAARADVLPALLETVGDAEGASDVVFVPPKPKESKAQAPRALVFRVFRDGKESESRRFVQETIKLGRGKSMDLCLDGESVSRFHALVDNTAEAIEIVDLGSSAGTFVNGNKVTKAKLSHGDTITIGTFRLELAISS